MRIVKYQRREGIGQRDTPFANAPGPSGRDSIAQGIDTLGRAVAAIQEQAAQTQATEALNEFNRTASDLLHNPETGLLVKEGSTVLGQDLEVYDALAKARTNTLRNLPNARAKRLFKDQTDQALIRYRGDIEKHVGTQITKARTNAMGNAINNAIDAVSKGGYADPDTFRQILSEMDTSITNLTESVEEYEAVRKKAVEDATKVAVRALIANKNLDEAQAFMNEYKEDMGVERHAIQLGLDKEIEIRDAKIFAAGVAERHRREDGMPDILAIRREAQRSDLTDEQRKALASTIADETAIRGAIIQDKRNDTNMHWNQGGFRLSAIPQELQIWMGENDAEYYARFLNAEAKRIALSSKRGAAKDDLQKTIDQEAEILYYRMSQEEKAEVDLETDPRFAHASRGLVLSLEKNKSSVRNALEKGQGPALKALVDRVLSTLEPTLPPASTSARGKKKREDEKQMIRTLTEQEFYRVAEMRAKKGETVTDADLEEIHATVAKKTIGKKGTTSNVAEDYGLLERTGMTRTQFNQVREAMVKENPTRTVPKKRFWNIEDSPEMGIPKEDRPTQEIPNEPTEAEVVQEFQRQRKNMEDSPMLQPGEAPQTIDQINYSMLTTQAVNQVREAFHRDKGRYPTKDEVVTIVQNAIRQGIF